MKKIRIGAGTGFYGDTIRPAIQSVKEGNLNYLCFDALAELTMAILQKDKQRNPDLGYTKDLEPMMRQLLPLCAENRVKILTNAGGINPLGAKKVVDKVVNELGLDLKVAVVVGDDVTNHLEYFKQNNLLVNMQSGERFNPEEHQISFANAYLGARPLVEALEKGADIVITGRTTDSAQFAAPLIYEFGWAWDDWDRLARAMTLGHLMECSAQSTGGNFSGDWRSINMVNIGYPIAIVDENGEAIMTKTPNSGGLVSKDTLKEQLLYEVHDPYNYILPDVIVNLADTQFEEIEKDHVRVFGTTGKPAPDSYKVLIGFENGYLGEAILGYCWPDALEKAQRAAEILVAQMELENIQYEDIHISYQGYNSFHGPLAKPDPEINEVDLRIAIHAKTKKDAARLGRLVPPLGLNGPPFSGGMSGMRKPRGLLGICPILVPKAIIDEHIKVG
nr:acyclic terpene utilization AtuA family protein [Fredinandcohnia onubensis]